jgi:hypothetical protein
VSVRHKAATYTLDNTNRINAHTNIHTFRTHDPVLERAKTVHALDRAATMIGTELEIQWEKVVVARLQILFPLMRL